MRHINVYWQTVFNGLNVLKVLIFIHLKELTCYENALRFFFLFRTLFWSAYLLWLMSRYNLTYIIKLWQSCASNHYSIGITIDWGKLIALVPNGRQDIDNLKLSMAEVMIAWLPHQGTVCKSCSCGNTANHFHQCCCTSPVFVLIITQNDCM